MKFQPTRPLRGATNFILMKGWSFYISTHAPLAGRDIRELCPQEGQNSFQPTRPLRGATFRRIDLCFDVIIFQPTRPLRGATPLGTKVNSSFGFQPTRPLRGATAKKTHPNATVLFQPTRPLRGATR